MTRLRPILTALLAVATLIAIGVVGWFSIALPLTDWRTDRLQARGDIISATERLIQSRDRLLSERANLQNTGELNLMWRSEQMGTAMALIQSEVSRMASENGVSLRSISPLPKRDISMDSAAGVRIELEATLDRLNAFLIEIEHSSPALLIDRAVMRRLTKPGQGPEQPLVFAQMDVTAPVDITQGGQP